MILEFLGNSGSGKSTLIPVLLRLAQERGLAAMSMTEAIHHGMQRTWVGWVVGRLVPSGWQGPILWRVFSYLLAPWYIASFAVRHPRLMRFVIGSQARRPISWSHRRLILCLYLEMIGHYAFLRHWTEPDQIVVLDEGFVHRVVHLLVSASEQPDVERVVAYLKLVPRPDLVVGVQAPLDLCLERIHSRGLQARLRDRPAHEVACFLAHAEQVVSVAFQYLQDAGWDTVIVSNDGDLAATATDIQHKLAGYLPEIVH
jgi:energy-coupling factor transporter ATP-binding protein EcfA2